MDESKIQDFLDEIKSQGKSSPAGMHWNDFTILLTKNKQPDGTDPPVPLILAASGASPESKHRRLRSQLEWARKNNCLDQAIEFLNKLDAHKWDTSPLSSWNTGSY